MNILKKRTLVNSVWLLVIILYLIHSNASKLNIDRSYNHDYNVGECFLDVNNNVGMVLEVKDYSPYMTVQINGVKALFKSYEMRKIKCTK